MLGFSSVPSSSTLWSLRACKEPKEEVQAQRGDAGAVILVPSAAHLVLSGQKTLESSSFGPFNSAAVPRTRAVRWYN